MYRRWAVRAGGRMRCFAIAEVFVSRGRHPRRAGHVHRDPVSGAPLPEPPPLPDGPVGRHPSWVGSPLVTTLFGRRVLLRPSWSSDFPAWREVRRRNEEWLTSGSPPGSPASPTCRGPRAFAVVAGPPARTPVGRRLRLRRLRRRVFSGEINLSSIQRGPFQSAYVGYWIDEARAGHGLHARGAGRDGPLRVRRARLHRIQIAIIPRNAASRRVVEKLAIRDEGIAERYSRSTASGRTTCATPSPSRSGTSGIAALSPTGSTDPPSRSDRWPQGGAGKVDAMTTDPPPEPALAPVGGSGSPGPAGPGSHRGFRGVPGAQFLGDLDVVADVQTATGCRSGRPLRGVPPHRQRGLAGLHRVHEPPFRSCAGADGGSVADRFDRRRVLPSAHDAGAFTAALWLTWVAGVRTSGCSSCS